mmetsp:Transcript_11547/g.11563  ORF Transcript_11547/g.11563 Transcript_11547/m.11563 type:complete len:138 (-) Transcript_11547:66-479(-)
MSQLNYVVTDAPRNYTILKWGHDTQMNKLKLETHKGYGYDLIIGSDILYYVDENTTPDETAFLFVKTVHTLLAYGKGKKCIISFHQRNISINILKEAFETVGFIPSVMTGYFEDIFGERNDEQTMFTNMFLLCFERL